MDVLGGIEAWHKHLCDSGRHPAGAVKIETLKEQPGWSLRVELAGTPLEGLQLAPYREGARDTDWLAYRIKDGRFEGRGDPTKLPALLFAFLELAERMDPEKKKSRRKVEPRRG